ncbi:MAG: hypothetical protein HC887_02260 [Desulfobacteraceae bacterium]|nr:hypothetical protein [Desulfobacteraceae bacterium]
MNFTDITDAAKRALNHIRLSLKIKFLSVKEENHEGVVIVEREEFAQKMRKKFGGNRELLKAVEKCMNRNVGKHEYVSLTD